MSCVVYALTLLKNSVNLMKKVHVNMTIQGFFWPFGEIFGTDKIGGKLCDFGKKYDGFANK